MSTQLRIPARKRGATESVANREYRTEESRRDRISSFSEIRCARSSVNYLDADVMSTISIDRASRQAARIVPIAPLHSCFPIFVYSCGSMHLLIQRVSSLQTRMESHFHERLAKSLLFSQNFCRWPRRLAGSFISAFRSLSREIYRLL